MINREDPNATNKALGRDGYRFFRSPLFPPADQRRQPYPFYAAMRHNQPIANDPANRLWAVYCYDDVKLVATDHQLFSSDRRKLTRTLLPETAELVRGNSLIDTDPPRHDQLRNLVSRAFTPRAIAEIEPRIVEIADELLDSVLPRGTMDLVRDFSDPLPVIVIAEMLGIPARDRRQFKQWSDDLIGESEGTDEELSDARLARRRSALADMDRYFLEVVEERRRIPRDDLITRLVQAEVDGERLSDDDLLAFCRLLLIAGNVTTTNLLGSALLSLLDHPDQFDRLRANPTLLGSAIEEVLRFEPPAQAVMRVSTTEVELRGERIPAGELVVAFIGSANRDAAVFPCPDEFNVARDPNPHLAFGRGIHFCLGAPLARLESRVALRCLFERARDFELADPGRVEFTRGFLHGVTRLPLRFSPSCAEPLGRVAA